MCVSVFAMIRALAALSVLLVVVAGDSDVVKNSVVKDGDNLKVVEGWYVNGC